jgi:hypothetical protein
MSDVKKKSELADGLSRRSFLGVGSAALAAATFVGLTAEAQQRRYALAKLPTDGLYIFPGDIPNSLAHDKAEVGGSKVESPTSTPSSCRR